MLNKNRGERMELAEMLNLQPGITAVIGGGGKTTFLRLAGELLSENHSVLLCTTTKIFPFDGIPCAENEEELHRLRKTGRLICAGTRLTDTGKLAAPSTSFEKLQEMFDYVLVEADGSAGRPMKAHAAHEPVIPAGCQQVLAVVGASGFGRTIAEAAHRPELYAQLAGAELDTPITPEIAACVLQKEQLHNWVLINQVETVEWAEWARRTAQLLDCPVAAGSLQRGVLYRCM